MKNLLVFLTITFLVACQPKKGSENGECENSKPATTQVDFQEEMHNFGKLEAGEILVYTFVFTNTGNHDLRIESVETDCGCIRATIPEKPVKPGKQGLIEVEFDSAGLWGRQLKSITIQANTEKPKQLVIFADVNNEQLNIKN